MDFSNVYLKCNDTDFSNVYLKCKDTDWEGWVSLFI